MKRKWRMIWKKCSSGFKNVKLFLSATLIDIAINHMFRLSISLC